MTEPSELALGCLYLFAGRRSGYVGIAVEQQQASLGLVDGGAGLFERRSSGRRVVGDFATLASNATPDTPDAGLAEPRFELFERLLPGCLLVTKCGKSSPQLIGLFSRIHGVDRGLRPLPFDYGLLLLRPDIPKPRVEPLALIRTGWTNRLSDEAVGTLSTAIDGDERGTLRPREPDVENSALLLDLRWGESPELDVVVEQDHGLVLSPFRRVHRPDDDVILLGRLLPREGILAHLEAGLLLPSTVAPELEEVRHGRRLRRVESDQLHQHERIAVICSARARRYPVGPELLQAKGEDDVVDQLVG